MPYPLLDGGAFSLYYTALGLLSQKTDLKILAINTPKDWVSPDELPADFIEKTRFEFSVVDTRFRFSRAFLNLFTKGSYFVERFFSEKFRAGLIKILQEEVFEIIQLEHVYLCLYLETIRKYSKAKVVLRPQNVENQVWNRYLKIKMNPATRAFLFIATSRLKRFETEMARKVDGIIAISPGDERLFRSYAPETPGVSVPIGFDFRNAGFYDEHRSLGRFPVFYHLGSMDWFPNNQGLKWFIEEVLPFVIKENPEFVLRIAGKKMPAWFYKRQSENLIVDGEVGDSLKYQEDKAILIVPLLSGGGLRAKIIEAMALGKTILSTTIGAEGIPYTDQENILIADSKEEFAIQIKQCMNSEEVCRKTGRSARELAIKNYDCNHTASQMIQFYHGLVMDLFVLYRDHPDPLDRYTGDDNPAA